MVIKFDPLGRVAMVLGRRPEDVEAPPAPGAPIPPPQPYIFNRPTDVAWDAAGNIFVADGYNNSRVVKYDKNGRYIKSWGGRGTDPGQFRTVDAIALDAKGNVYAADRENKRIQVFDNDGKFLTQWTNIGSPWSICITPGPHQVLYTSNSNGPGNMDHGEIYKLELDGRILGKFGNAGKLIKEFGSVNEIDCRNENQIYVAELTNWRIQRLLLHSEQTR
jgi:DNA-binding beta-propeller fold protein YncE